MASTRALCPHCDFILARCICDSLTPVFNLTELIILQHPSETKHALNTVRIMKKSFQKIRVFIGENFDDDSELKNILDSNKVALLFPGEKSQILSEGNEFFPTHLILIDGSWNKARKIFYSSTILHSLPAFSLQSNEKSNYRIRASRFKESLSTLEASIVALGILEPDLSCESLKKSFAKMIDFQIEKMGADLYENNYLKKKDGE